MPSPIPRPSRKEPLESLLSSTQVDGDDPLVFAPTKFLPPLDALELDFPSLSCTVKPFHGDVLCSNSLPSLLSFAALKGHLGLSLFFIHRSFSPTPSSARRRPPRCPFESFPIVVKLLLCVHLVSRDFPGTITYYHANSRVALLLKTTFWGFKMFN